MNQDVVLCLRAGHEGGGYLVPVVVHGLDDLARLEGDEFKCAVVVQCQAGYGGIAC